MYKRQVVMVLTMVACGEGKKKADGQVVIGTSTEASGDWEMCIRDRAWKAPLRRVA